jgi:UDP-N-acetylmuramoyl-tripeptide--D-alanyl-D-alanine ligase
MIPMTLGEIAAAVGGTLVDADPDVTVTGTVEFDSRKVGPGGLFVAFDGAKLDGHDFAGAALSAGAVAVLGTRPIPARVLAGRPSAPVPTILVGDALAAIGALARAVLDRLPDLTVVGITGSSGKTSTKDLIGQLLERLGPTIAPAGSFNNELGLPHTVLRADAATRFLVLEMGARGPGHLTYLCGIAPPRIGVVVNVGVAHIGEFGSVDAIERAKGELVEALPARADGRSASSRAEADGRSASSRAEADGRSASSRAEADGSSARSGAGGTAVLNADDPRVRAMASRTGAAVVLAGEADDAAVRAVDVSLDDRGRPSFTLSTAEGHVPVALRVSGRHQVGNALLAAAVARAAGMPLAEVGAALGEVTLVSTRRMDVFDRPDGVTVIDDSYNANPASTAAALRALVAIGQGRRQIAVLGYLAELGERERDGHEEVGRLAAELGVDLVVVVSDAAAGIHDGATSVAHWGGDSVLVTDQAAALGWLREQLRAGDVVLVKGSRYRTWDVVDGLRVLDGSAKGGEVVTR